MALIGWKVPKKLREYCGFLLTSSGYFFFELSQLLSRDIRYLIWGLICFYNERSSGVEKNRVYLLSPPTSAANHRCRTWSLWSYSLSLSQFFNSTISVTMETQFLGTMSWLPSASLLACHLKKEHVHVVPVAVSVTWLINGCRFCSVYSYGFYIGPAQLLQQVTAGRVYCAERMRCDETLALSAIVGRICSWKCWWI